MNLETLSKANDLSNQISRRKNHISQKHHDDIVIHFLREEDKGKVRELHNNLLQKEIDRLQAEFDAL